MRDQIIHKTGINITLIIQERDRQFRRTRVVHTLHNLLLREYFVDIPITIKYIFLTLYVYNKILLLYVNLIKEKY